MSKETIKRLLVIQDLTIRRFLNYHHHLLYVRKIVLHIWEERKPKHFQYWKLHRKLHHKRRQRWKCRRRQICYQSLILLTRKVTKERKELVLWVGTTVRKICKTQASINSDRWCFFFRWWILSARNIRQWWWYWFRWGGSRWKQRWLRNWCQLQNPFLQMLKINHVPIMWIL